MIIKTIKFIGSYTELKMCPSPDKPEYAFIGRSNVGKSSLINMIANIDGLAHTSRKPGKTQTMNYFDINGEWYMVDLPGYGFAKMPKKMRDAWQIMTDDYLLNRPNLQCAFLLIDSCVPPQQADLDFANWMGEHGVPFVIAFTKTDRKKAAKNDHYLENFQKAFLEYWSDFPTYFITSSEEKIGRDGILTFIGDVNSRFSLTK